MAARALCRWWYIGSSSTYLRHCVGVNRRGRGHIWPWHEGAARACVRCAAFMRGRATKMALRRCGVAASSPTSMPAPFLRLRREASLARARNQRVIVSAEISTKAASTPKTTNSKEGGVVISANSRKWAYHADASAWQLVCVDEALLAAADAAGRLARRYS